MFISHYATGLAFYTREKGSKLMFFFLVLGTQFVDVLWGLFTFLGIEGGFTGGSVEYNAFDVPWSHSLIMMIVWSVIYGFATNWYVARSNTDTGNFAIISGFSVFSHWILDFLVHNDDMLIMPIGSDATVPTLYLWEFPMVTFFLEILIIGGAWYYYWSNHTETEFRTSKKPLASLIFLLVVHILGYLPSFDDAAGMDQDSAAGFAIMLALPILAGIMTWLHVEGSTDKS